jgi:SAM-dependent methyltransferase
MSYILDKQKEEARKRLSLIARIEDPGTIAHLLEIGVRPGWRCLEVGAGAGTIASWLLSRVGPGGRVVATDLDTTFIEPLQSETLEVRRHDVVFDEVEEDAFDLVHVRNVLVHVPERVTVLEKLARSLKPGGFLLAEELDVVTDCADPEAPQGMQALYEKVVGEIYRFVRAAGLDPSFGRRLPGLLQRMGFEEVRAEGRAHVFHGHPTEPSSAHVPAFVELKEPIVARGSVSSEEFDEFIGLTRNPEFSWREGLTVASWGRKRVG